MPRLCFNNCWHSKIFFTCLISKMTDTYTMAKKINVQLSNINASRYALSAVDSLSTPKFLFYFDSNAPANTMVAQARVTNKDIAFLRAGMLGVQNIE